MNLGAGAIQIGATSEEEKPQQGGAEMPLLAELERGKYKAVVPVGARIGQSGAP